MTKILIDEATVKLALEALEEAANFLTSPMFGDAATALKALAEQPAPKIVDCHATAVQKGVLARKWILHGSFADVASFDSEGVPSFYWKESIDKFQKGQLSAPCKGKNCGSLNGWLHSAECRAEHEAQYTAPQPAHRKPLTQTQVVEGFCKQPHDVQFVSVFDAGVRFAEAAHNIKEKNNG